ncbi:unnamed protein product [Peniophora sp. CBMAI 1063]|nr:unnamed protein product [Peniophora sp. CBMAI 1063]
MAPASAPVTPDGKLYSTPARVPRTAAAAHRLPASRLADLQSMFPSPLSSSDAGSSPFSTLSLNTPQWSDRASSAFTTPESIKYAAAQSPLARRSRGQQPDDDWRARATEHGIRVDRGSFDDDENYPVHHEGKRQKFDYEHEFDPLAALGVSPLAYRRTRADIENEEERIPYQSIAPPPMLPTTPARRTLGALNTPPRRDDRLKTKGSMTDPAYPRRRPTYPVSDLFDIDENDHAQHQQYPLSFSASHARNRTVDGFEEFELAPPKFYHQRQASFDSMDEYQEPQPQQQQQPPAQVDPAACPVCGNRASTLVALAPCAHVLCSACFTSALNIVGEKNMECAVCRCAVDNFQMKPAPASTAAAPVQQRPSPQQQQQPSYTRQTSRSSLSNDKNNSTVLRIDNVPWDVTPPMVKAWLKQPGAVKRVHVLLDRKGKTQSHAFVEMRDEDAARAALRTAQNSVLGRGKRARGVTVTRTSEDELLAALFPSWRGVFENGVPVLRNLSETEQLSALAAGVLDDVELRALLSLVRSPDSHFVKVPSLPFHALISVLDKLPPEGQHGRALHTPARRDALFEAALAAAGVLASDEGARRATADDPGLLAELLEVASHCAVFTPAQRATLRGLAEVGGGSRAGSAASSISVGTNGTGGFPMMCQGPGMDSPSTASSELGYGVDEFAPPGLGGIPYGVNEFGEYVSMQAQQQQQRYVPPPQRRASAGTAPVGMGRAQGAGHAMHGRRAVSTSSQARLSALAREFQCDPGLVEAVAARLAAGELM